MEQEVEQEQEQEAGGVRLLLTLQFVLGPPALHQGQVAHNVLQLHRVQGRGRRHRRRRRRGGLQGGRRAFYQLQPCRETPGGKVRSSITTTTTTTAAASNIHGPAGLLCSALPNPRQVGVRWLWGLGCRVLCVFREVYSGCWSRL